MKRSAAFLGVVLIGCHSEPYGDAFYGAEGGLAPGSETRLTFSAGDRYGRPFHTAGFGWAQDGIGIVYTYGPRSFQFGGSTTLSCVGSHDCVPVSRDALDTCAGMLPPDGGSAYWELCETRKPHTDSTDIIDAAAVDRHGELVYAELTGQWGLPVPIGFHGELWISDPTHPQGRRKLVSMYPHVIPGGNWLDDVQWAGDNQFFARAGTWSAANQDYTVGPVVIGQITPDSAIVAEVPGTGGTTSYTMTEGGAALLTTNGSQQIARVSVASGATSVVGAIPDAARDSTLGVSCGGTACVVLSSDSTPTRWRLWRLDPVTGAISLLRSFDHPISAAKLSPVSGRVVTLEGVNLYMLDLVVH
jgi:hypothetical protein